MAIRLVLSDRVTNYLAYLITRPCKLLLLHCSTRIEIAYKQFQNYWQAVQLITYICAKNTFQSKEGMIYSSYTHYVTIQVVFSVRHPAIDLLSLVINRLHACINGFFQTLGKIFV